MPDLGSQKRTRSRDLPSPVIPDGMVLVKETQTGLNPHESSSGGTGTVSVPFKPGRQITVSEGHLWPPRKGTLTDAGGEFHTSKTYVEVDTRVYNLTRPKWRYFVEYAFDGSILYERFRSVINQTPLLPINPSVDLASDPFPESAESSENDLMEKGATAVARCKPTNTGAELATFLGETIKDGLPAIVGAKTWKEKTLNARNAGSEYLNVEFGIKPMIADIRKLANTMIHAEKVMSQYERDSGRVVRRQYRFPSQTVSREETIAFDRTPLGYLSSEVLEGATKSRVLRTTEVLRKTWFSGAFTYHLPSGYDSRKGMRRAALFAQEILGLELTPEVIWELTPWSWAIDWFTNAGDVLSNISDALADGLVMRYGYIMEHTVHRVTYTLPDFVFSYSNVKVPPLSFVSETKVRKRANPFGFGITWEGLSPRQIAILVALGITRS